MNCRLLQRIGFALQIIGTILLCAIWIAGRELRRYKSLTLRSLCR